MNTDVLRGVIYMKGYTEKDVYTHLCMDRKTFRKRMNDKKFNREEIVKICKFLNISDWATLFFPELVTSQVTTAVDNDG